MVRVSRTAWSRVRLPEPSSGLGQGVRSKQGMSCYLYILRSRVDGKLYVGHTKNLARRLELHNLGTVRSTRRRAPFDLVYAEEFSTRGEAVKKEKFLKSLEGSTLKRALVEKYCGSNSDG